MAMAYDPVVINFAKTSALILRTYEYSETSYVVSLLTRDYGKLHALAKGGRRPKGTFGGEIDLFAEGQAVLVMHPETSLHLLTEFGCRRRWLGLRSTLDRAYAACYAAEIAGAASPEGEPQPELYELVTTTLDSLEAGDAAAVVAFFQVHLLMLAGFMPDLQACVVCGKAVSGRQVNYCFVRSGLICGECMHPESETPTRSQTPPACRSRAGRTDSPESIYRTSHAAITLIRSLAREGGAAIRRTRVPRPLALEAIRFLGYLIASAFEHDPSALANLLPRLKANDER